MTTADQLQPGHVSGALGGRFVLGARVAEGAMGEVFSAEDRTTGARVALKRMAVTRDRERFLDECEILRRVSHPAIVAYVAHGIDDGRPWLAMEWLDGEDLAARLSRARATLEETVAWLRGAAEGLGAAHAVGVVHRDVKPENLVLVPDDGVPVGHRLKIVDFGVARADVARRAATRTGVIVGTPAYMAPEQVRSARDLDPRADVFALGCIAYECLADRPAFVAESLLATFAKVIFEDPPPLHEVDPGIPRALSDLVARMMAKERSARPPNGAAVAAELAALLEGDASPDLAARGPGATTSPGPPAGPVETLADEPVQVHAVRVAAVDRNHCVGHAWNVALLVWGKTTTLEGVASAERAIFSLADQHPAGIGLLTVVESIADPPSAEVRRAIAGMLAAMSSKVVRSAVAQEGTGFRAAMVRGVVTGLTLVSRLSYPHRVFDTMEVGIAWIMDGLPPGPERPPDAAAVIAAARELRLRFDDHRSRGLVG